MKKKLDLKEVRRFVTKGNNNGKKNLRLLISQLNGSIKVPAERGST